MQRHLFPSARNLEECLRDGDGLDPRALLQSLPDVGLKLARGHVAARIRRVRRHVLLAAALKVGLDAAGLGDAKVDYLERRVSSSPESGFTLPSPLGRTRVRKENRGALTVPVRVHLPRHALCPALDGKLARVIVRMARERAHARKRRHIEDDPAAVLLVLAHLANSPHRNARRSEEERLDLLVRLLLRRRLRVPGQRVPGVVHDHVHVETVSKVCGRSLKRLVDRLGRRDVQRGLEDLVALVGEIGQRRGVSRGRNEALPGLLEDELVDLAPDATGASRNCPCP